MTATRPDATALHALLLKDGTKYNKWLKIEAIPALQQLLMAEHESIREVLVDQLALIDGKEATEALAQRALYDLHPAIRQRAIEALAKRPEAEYRDTLLGGFRYPWPAVAEHAAEAIIALKMKDTTGTLLRYLDMPDPKSPYHKPGQGKFVKEMVKINHLRNCLMCHAPSLNQDEKVRGFVPPTNQPLPPPFTRAYYSSSQQGVFVRADVTYLKQDFSVPLPVKHHGLWPAVQRFDFMVRERPASKQELANAGKVTSNPTDHQKSIFFALRELTGKDPGPTAQDWKRLLIKRAFETRTIETGLKAPHALAVDATGRIYLQDEATLFTREGDGNLKRFTSAPGDLSSMAFDARGRLVATSTNPPLLVHIDGASGESRTLTREHAGVRFHAPRRLAPDSNGGVYFCDDPGFEGRADSCAVYYLSSHGSVTQLPVRVPRPRGLAVSPDGKKLFVVSAVNAEVLAYPIESVGAIGKGTVLCGLSSAGPRPGTAADISVDGRGMICVLNATTRSVEIFTQTGAKVSSVKLNDRPIACTIGGDRRQTLYILLESKLVTLDLSPASPL